MNETSEPDGTNQADSPPGVPRWLKALGAVALALVVLGIGVMALGGSEHGPGRHVPPTSTATAAPR